MIEQKLFTKPSEIEIINGKENTNKNEDNKEESAKDLLLKWTETLTIHAIPNIFRTRHLIIKIIWMISFLISTGLCAYMVYGSINNYLQFNVVTTIREIIEAEMTFPSVTVCNINPFVTESSFQFVYLLAKSNLGVDLFDILNENITSVNLLNSKYKLFEMYITLNFLIKQTVTSPKFGKQSATFGYSFDKFVISCFFGYEPCDENDFVQYYDMIHGSCFKFNSGKFKNGSKAELKKVTGAGRTNGLILELFVGDASDPRSLSFSPGAHVFIHNDSLTPNPNEGYDLGPGTATNFAMHKTYLSKLEYPYSGCTDNLNDANSYDSDYYRMIMNSNNSYRQSDCFTLCYEIYLIKKCQCYDTVISFLDVSVNPCLSHLEISCQLETLKTFVSNGYEKMCSGQCPAECHSTSYGFVASSTAFPSRSYAYNMLKDPNILSRFENSTKVDYETLKENILTIYVNYDALKSTVIEEAKQMEFVDFIAGIGGTLGLFLGVSVLSLFEVVEVLLEILLSIKNKQKSNRIESVN